MNLEVLITFLLMAKNTAKYNQAIALSFACLRRVTVLQIHAVWRCWSRLSTADVPLEGTPHRYATKCRFPGYGQQYLLLLWLRILPLQRRHVLRKSAPTDLMEFLSTATKDRSIKRVTQIAAVTHQKSITCIEGSEPTEMLAMPIKIVAVMPNFENVWSHSLKKELGPD